MLCPEERITVEQALKAITLDAAFVLGVGNDIGSLATGKIADFYRARTRPPRPQRHSPLGDRLRRQTLSPDEHLMLNARFACAQEPVIHRLFWQPDYYKRHWAFEFEVVADSNGAAWTARGKWGKASIVREGNWTLAEWNAMAVGLQAEGPKVRHDPSLRAIGVGLSLRSGSPGRAEEQSH